MTPLVKRESIFTKDEILAARRTHHVRFIAGVLESRWRTLRNAPTLEAALLDTMKDARVVHAPLATTLQRSYVLTVFAQDLGTFAVTSAIAVVDPDPPACLLPYHAWTRIAIEGGRDEATVTDRCIRCQMTRIITEWNPHVFGQPLRTVTYHPRTL